MKASLAKYWPGIAWDSVQKLSKKEWDGRSLMKRAKAAAKEHGELLMEERWKMWSMVAHGRMPGTSQSPFWQAFAGCEALHYGANFSLEMTRLLGTEYECDVDDIAAWEAIACRWFERTGIERPEEGE